MDDSVVSSSSFLVSVSGQIESAHFIGIDNIYCKYSFKYGNDWTVASGTEDGISQITRKSGDEKQLFVWNFPLEIALRSTNPFGWPQLVSESD